MHVGVVGVGRIGAFHAATLAARDEAPHESSLPGSGGIFRDRHIHDFDSSPPAVPIRVRPKKP